MAEHLTQPDLPSITIHRRWRPVPEAEALGLLNDDAPPRISVVLPACNELGLLQNTFDQFCATVPPRSEIIVVDNGSTDGCADFLADSKAHPADGRARLIDTGREPAGVAVWLLRYPEPLGVVGARNIGLKHARGEVVVFSDANLHVPSGWWPPLIATLNQAGVGVVGPALTMMGMPEHGKACGMRIGDARLGCPWLRCGTEAPHPVPVVPGALMAFRREVLDEVGSYDDGFRQRAAEDVEICLRLWLLGYEVWVVPEVEVAHFYRSASPYPVDWTVVLANQLRVGLLHLGTERLARFMDAWMREPRFPRAMALCADSDVWARRAELMTWRLHDDDWFFSHPYFRDFHDGL